MTQMTPEQLKWRDETVVLMKEQNGAMARQFLAQLKSYLAGEADPHQAVYLYLYLQENCGLIDETPEPFDVVAPLVKLDTAAFETIKVAASAKKIADDKDFERGINMYLAKMRVEQAIAQHGEDSEQAGMAIAKAIAFLPDEERAKIDANMRELGLIPAASGYLENGEPVFTIEAIAAHLGMDPEKVMQDAAEFSMTVDAASIHRPQ
jgi:hypothetical protein